MTPEQLAALKEVAEAVREKGPWQRGGDYWCKNVVTAKAGTEYVADCGVNEATFVIAEFIAAFDPTTCLKLLKHMERLTVIAEASRDFVWDPENWEAYQDSQDSNSAAWPPEFLIMAQLIEKTYGPMPVDDDGENQS